jgi:predicted ATPase
MRIAVSGSHRVGKTTLAEALADALPGHVGVPEPYLLLEEEGHEFAEVPAIEDFELQLERSFRCSAESGSNVVFDRCALDILGYLLTHRDADAFQLEEWMPRVEESVASLDLVVFAPIEEPDRIAVLPSMDPLRAQVDAVLRDVIIDDAYGMGFDVITAEGTAAERLRRVMEELRLCAEGQSG